MIRFIYNLFWPVGLLFFLPGYFRKMIRRGGYREKFGQRLGIYDRELRARLSERKSTWLHAVSVGEVNVALRLARALRALEPDLRCALTTTTTTGFALARKNAPPWIEVMYTPLDYWPIMRRAFSVIRPARILLIEAEVWPNLVAFARGYRIPTALVNARLSPKSEKRFRRFQFIVAPTFRLLDLVCVPENEDADRWAALRVSRDRIRVTGSIKYDSVGLGRINPAVELFEVPPSGGSADDSLAGSPGRLKPELRTPNAEVQESTDDVPLPRLDPKNDLVLFGGSTHHGEEEILATVFVRLRQQFSSLRLFIAPRHVERLREIRTRLDALRLHVRRSEEHTSELQSRGHLVCRLLLEKKNTFSHSTRNKTRDGLIRVRNIRALNVRFNTSITHAYSIVIGSKHITLNATGGGFLTASKQFRHGATSKSRSNTASNSTKHKSPHLSGWRQIISLIT